MTQTVVGTFESFREAEEAQDALVDAGFTRNQIRLNTQPESFRASAGSTAAGGRAGEAEPEGVMASIRDFFRDLFGDHDHPPEVSHYTEAVRRGGALVAVDVDDDERVEVAHQTLVSAGAIDIDERAAQWASTGTYTPGGNTAFSSGAATPGSGYGVENGTAYTAGTAASGTPLGDTTGVGTRDTAYTREPVSTGAVGREASGTDKVLPVVHEEMEIGKRQVQTGGVRVYSRSVDTPVSENVRLREEHAHVERRPVDRPATAADLDRVRDEAIEVRETAEKAVVSKTARVVEEVVVGKNVTERTETVTGTVRNTDVSVEQLGDTSATGSDFDAYDTEFRSHHQSFYAAQGGAYDDYEPAYRHGYTLANDPRYSGSDWNSVEPDARRDWEARNPGSSWERMKAGVRHAWEKVRGRA